MQKRNTNENLQDNGSRQWLYPFLQTALKYRLKITISEPGFET